MEKHLIDSEACHITCGIAHDIMPLVIDGVASEDSEAALGQHMEHCGECRALWAEFSSPKPRENAPAPNDREMMAYIRRQAVFLIGFVMLLGAAVGIMMLNTPLTFQNLLIMPIVGALSYCGFKRKGLLTAAAVFLMTTARGLVESSAGEGQIFHVLSAVIYGIILGALVVVGMAIAALLDFAFKKENQ